MKVQFEYPVRTNQCLKTMSFFLLLLADADSILSENPKCPFQYLYHFGDGFTDIGNSIHVLPWGPFLPAASSPYGMTFPGTPTGRWSDGLTDMDLGAPQLGVPNIAPFLAMNKSKSYDGVIFSVARSPVLDRDFFTSRGIDVPPFVASLRVQLHWFKAYLKSICSTPSDCKDILGNSAIFFGDLEGNDIGYPLIQGKSIQEVKTYVPFVIHETMKAARELIVMGATRLIIPANVPVGCYPYILTKLQSTNPADYDELGCLKRVNDLILLKNKALEQAIANLSMEFPAVGIFFGNLYNTVRTTINQTMASGRNGLKACCGIGGNYNFDDKRFCGSRGVPVCSNPDRYVFWDGIHFTQEVNIHSQHVSGLSVLAMLNCTDEVQFASL